MQPQNQPPPLTKSQYMDEGRQTKSQYIDDGRQTKSQYIEERDIR